MAARRFLAGAETQLVDRRRLELAYSLMITLPGTTVIRYGNEIGMGDDPSLPERKCALTPMQWSSERHGGFTDGNTPVLPVIEGGPYGALKLNVAAQRRDPDFLLNWTECMLRMRKVVPEIGWGTFTVMDCGRSDVFGLCYSWRNNNVVFIHNLNAEPLDVHVTPSTDGLLVTCLAPTSAPLTRMVHIPSGWKLMGIAGSG